MNIAIVGGRDFSDYTLLKESILAYINTHEKPENIVSGGAKGADTLAAQFAAEMGIPLLVFKPDSNHRKCRSGFCLLGRTVKRH